MKKSTLIVVIVLLVAMAVLGRRWWVKSDHEVAALAAGPAPAAIIPDSTSVILRGRVGAGRTEPLIAKKAGRVRSIYFEAGQYVRSGMVIAKMTDFNFITAPHDGFLCEQRLTVGEYVKPGTVVASISQHTYLVVSIMADSSISVHPGDSVHVWASARPTRVVTGITVLADNPTSGTALEIRCPSRSPLRIGEIASVKLPR
ncbi:efflux RND transporter periplasmic adaptor subunit [Hymenobacter agri]